jgi:hypothetical protein
MGKQAMGMVLSMGVVKWLVIAHKITTALGIAQLDPILVLCHLAYQRTRETLRSRFQRA